MPYIKNMNSPALHTRDSICAAPNFMVLVGEAEDPQIPAWALFETSGCTCGDTELATKMTGVEVFDLSPSRDDELCVGLTKANGEQFDDIDAALAYLRKGGTLCKVPDHEGSKHFRFLAAVSIVL